MDEQVGLDLLGRPQRELLVGAVHRVAGLEGDDLAPAQRVELVAELGRRLAQRPEVVVVGQLQALEAARDVAGVRPLEQVGDAGVLGVGRAEDQLGLGLPVGASTVSSTWSTASMTPSGSRSASDCAVDRVGHVLGQVER